MVTKWCSSCKQDLENTNFSRNKHQVSGLNTVCRNCDSIRHKIYRNKNKEVMNKKASEYYQNNKEVISIKGKERYNKDPVKYLIKWWARNVSKIQATPKWANKKYIELFYKLAKEETMRTGKQVEVDHIVPLRGKLVCGLHCEQNLQLLFKEDNRKKAANFMAEMRNW